MNAHLSPSGFDRLLACLDPDRERAAEQYRLLHRKLSKLLEIRGSATPLEHADESIDRVARKLEQGEQIRDIFSFSATVARLVALEAKRSVSREQIAHRDLQIVQPASCHNAERRQQCLDMCLDRLDHAHRNVLLAYYRDEGRARIERRREIADLAGIPLNALRIRVHRIRTQLEECLTGCLEREK